MMFENIVIGILKINLLAAIVIGIVLFVSKFLKNRYSSLWKYSMWIVISVFLLFPVSLLSNTPLINIRLPQSYRVASDNQTAKADQSALESNRADEINKNSGNGVKVDTASGETTVTNKAPVTGKTTVLGENVASGGNAGTQVSDAAEPGVYKTATAVAIRDWVLKNSSMILICTWLGISLLLLIIRSNLYALSTRKLRRWSMPVRDYNARHIYRTLWEARQIRRAPKLMINPKLSGPLLVGVIHPTLYLPEEKYSEAEYRMIFSHELSHFERRDLWYKLMLLIVRTVYWFNPMLRVMAGEGDKAVEYLCDNRVVKDFSHSDRIRYNQLLLKTAGVQKTYYLCASLSDGATAFKDRVYNIMNTNKQKRGILMVLVLSLTLLLSNVLVGCSIKGEAADLTKQDATAASAETDTKSNSTEQTDHAANQATDAQADTSDAKTVTPSPSGAAPTTTAPATTPTTVPTATPAPASTEALAPTPTEAPADAAGNTADAAENVNSGQTGDAQPSSDAGVASKNSTSDTSAIAFSQARLGLYSNSSEPTVYIDVLKITENTVEFTITDLKTDSGDFMLTDDKSKARITEHAIGRIVGDNTVVYKDENYNFTMTWGQWSNALETGRADELAGIIHFQGNSPSNSSIQSGGVCYSVKDQPIVHVS